MAKQYMALEQAQQQLLDNTHPVEGVESCNIIDALGRVCSEDFSAIIAQPPFDRSPLDGYALRSEDALGATPDSPVKLRVTQWIFAGDSPDGPIAQGEAARIMTGGMLPPGADCVIWQEDTDRGEREVTIYASPAHHENFCFKGEDVSEGRLLIAQGRQINHADVGVLAGQGRVSVNVFRKPRVAVASGGDELALPGSELPPGKIYDSNSQLLAARLRQLGAHASVQPSLGDDKSVILGRVKAMLEQNDLVITTGGVSVGLKDYMPAVASELGGELLFHGIRVKPGSPALAVAVDGKMLIALSGNPFAAAATFEVLAAPVVRKLMGIKDYGCKRVRGVARGQFNKPSKNRRLVRAHIVGGEVFIPAEGHASGMLSALADCNCLIDIPAGTPKIEDGQQVEAILF